MLDASNPPRPGRLLRPPAGGLHPGGTRGPCRLLGGERDDHLQLASSRIVAVEWQQGQTAPHSVGLQQAVSMPCAAVVPAHLSPRCLSSAPQGTQSFKFWPSSVGGSPQRGSGGRGPRAAGGRRRQMGAPAARHAVPARVSSGPGERRTAEGMGALRWHTQMGHQMGHRRYP